MTKAQRGEVWLADLGLAGKTRPVLVISIEYDDNERALFAVVPHTTSKRGGRFEVSLKIPWLGDGAFDVQGTRPVPPPALLRKLGFLNQSQMANVELAIKLWYGV